MKLVSWQLGGQPARSHGYSTFTVAGWGQGPPEEEAYPQRGGPGLWLSKRPPGSGRPSHRARRRGARGRRVAARTPRSRARARPRVAPTSALGLARPPPTRARCRMRPRPRLPGRGDGASAPDQARPAVRLQERTRPTRPAARGCTAASAPGARPPRPVPAAGQHPAVRSGSRSCTRVPQKAAAPGSSLRGKTEHATKN